jgi:hypothetical protein
VLLGKDLIEADAALFVTLNAVKTNLLYRQVWCSLRLVAVTLCRSISCKTLVLSNLGDEGSRIYRSAVVL